MWCPSFHLHHWVALTRFERYTPRCVSPNSQKNFKKEYHNRAERERTRKINNSIQEIRLLTGCVETDKVSILESASKCITDINAGTYKPSPRVKTAASRSTAAAATSPTAMSVVAQSQSPPSAPPAAAPPAVAIQPDAYRDISPLFDGEQPVLNQACANCCTVYQRVGPTVSALNTLCCAASPVYSDAHCCGNDISGSSDPSCQSIDGCGHRLRLQ